MMRRTLRSLFHEESGASSVEHALLAALIAAAIIMVGVGLSSALNGKFVATTNALK